jgi:hypothetical protein
VLLERDSGKPVPKIELRARDGKPLDPAATFVKKLPAAAGARKSRGASS